MPTVTIRPNALGTNIYTPFGDTPNYKCVDETSADDDTTYVYTDNVKDSTIREYYNLGPSGLLSHYTITGVTIYARVKSTGAQSNDRFGISIKKGDGTVIGFAYRNTTTGWVNYDYADWFTSLTVAEVDALQVGYMMARPGGVAGQYMYCTQIWAVVTYTIVTQSVVTNQVVTAITGTTATGNGNITTLGDTPTQHGHCWNTTGTPTTANLKTTKGIPAVTGAFTSAITGLTAGTKYYVRAYVTDTTGTVYSGGVIFWADKGTVYPSEPLARVTNLIHRYDARQSINQLEISLGDITSVLTPPFMESPARATADKQKAQDSIPIIDTAKAVVALKNYWSRQIPPYSANVTALQPEPRPLTAKQLGMTQEELAKLANQPGIVELLRQLGKR